MCQAAQTCRGRAVTADPGPGTRGGGAPLRALLTSQVQRRAGTCPCPRPALLHATHLHKPIVELQRGRVQAFQEPWVRQDLLQGGRRWEGVRAGGRAGVSRGGRVGGCAALGHACQGGGSSGSCQAALLELLPLPGSVNGCWGLAPLPAPRSERGLFAGTAMDAPPPPRKQNN